ncbi:MAG: 2Fe-2S iron-sulfur cluster binding domain-containing protein [Cellvibrionaceae bacterium]|nr:2Fe-2S iron-sulfur cluster binding domain-containing protein [Cellvibrionaceae bacterium]
MAKLFFDGKAVPIGPSESILDALLRDGYNVPYGCKSGACQSCMLQAQSGELPANCQPGLSDSLKQLGYFLSCSCYPKADATLQVHSSPDSVQKVPAVVKEKTFIGKNTLRLRLRAAINYQPGQYLTVWKDAKLARSYSIASVASLQPELEFHIKHIPQGEFSNWVATALQTGDTLYLQGPMGTCFYTSGKPEQPLVLAGIGTGLAPLYGILREALEQQHSGEVFLYVGAKSSENFYYVEKLKQLESSYSNVQVKFICQHTTADHSGDYYVPGDIYEIIKQRHPDMKQHKIFLCGAESFVRKLKKQCFLAGANMNEILVDTFLAFKS